VDKATIAKEAELGPSSTELLGAEYAKKRRRILLGVLGALAVGGAAIAGVVVFQQRQAKARANEAFGALSTCLFGEVLDPGATPSARFRSHQLAAMSLGEKDRAMVDKTAWPQRCGNDAQALVERAKEAGLSTADAKDVGYWADQLGKALKAQNAHLADVSEPLDAAFAEAKKAGLTGVASAKTQGPPKAAAAETIDGLKKSTPLTSTFFPLKELTMEQHQGESHFALVQDATVEPPVFLCSFKAEGIECGRLPENLTKAGHGLRLLGTTDQGASPLVFEGNRGDAGIYRSDTGEKVDALYSYGGWASKGGSAFVLGWNEEEKKAFLSSKNRGDKMPSHEELKLDFDVGNFYYSSQILWDRVVLRGVTKDWDRRLFVMSIDEKSGKLGDPVDVGALPEPGEVSGGPDEPPHITGCRSEGAMVVRVKGRDNDFVSFFIDGKWTKPLSSSFFQGALTCEGAQASVVSVTQGAGQSPWKAIIDETRCTSAKCEVNHITMEELLPGGLELAPRASLIDAAALGDKLVVAWAAGERGGVRVRVGLGRELAQAKDVLVLDDLVSDGKIGSLSTVSDLRLVSAPGHAVLFLATKVGVFPLRVEASGEVKPEKVVWK
jgi:hypothetical protein